MKALSSITAGDSRISARLISSPQNEAESLPAGRPSPEEASALDCLFNQYLSDIDGIRFPALSPLQPEEVRNRSFKKKPVGGGAAGNARRLKLTIAASWPDP